MFAALLTLSVLVLVGLVIGRVLGAQRRTPLAGADLLEEMTDAIDGFAFGTLRMDIERSALVAEIESASVSSASEGKKGRSRRVRYEQIEMFAA